MEVLQDKKMYNSITSKLNKYDQPSAKIDENILKNTPQGRKIMRQMVRESKDGRIIKVNADLYNELRLGYVNFYDLKEKFTKVYNENLQFKKLNQDLLSQIGEMKKVILELEKNKDIAPYLEAIK
ncbi:MAG: hypothetical protein ACXVHT_04905, partial [Methanobacterium sp.]